VLDYLGFLVSLHLSVGFGIANIIHREFLFRFTPVLHCDNTDS